MTAIDQMKFRIDKETATLHIEREFEASIKRVWDAYTRSELLDQWWAPHPWKARTTRMDFREGGEWLYAMVGPNGEEHYGLMKYHKIKPLDHFEGEDAFCDADGNIHPEMPVASWRNQFMAKGDKTLVTVTTSYPSIDQLNKVIEMGMKEGIAIAMQQLDELLRSE